MHRSCFGTLFVCLTLLTSTGCESELARQISYYESTDDSEAAIAHLEEAVRVSPEDTEAHYLLGKLLFEEGRYREGLKHLDRSRAVSVRYESEIEYQVEYHLFTELEEAESAFESEAYAEAAQSYVNASHIVPGNVRYRVAAAGSYALAGDRANAVELYRNVLEEQGTDPEALNNLAQLLYENDDLSESISLSDRVAPGESSRELYDISLRRLFYAHTEREEFTDAFNAYDRLSSRSPDLRREHAIVAFRAGAYERSLSEVNGLLKSDPRDRQLVLLKAENLKQLRRIDEMIAVLQTYAAVFPEDRDVRTNLMAGYEYVGLTDKADELRVSLAEDEE